MAVSALMQILECSDVAQVTVQRWSSYHYRLLYF